MGASPYQGGYLYDDERLLIETIRREKYLSLGEYKSAIFYFRRQAEIGKLNHPKLMSYLEKMKKNELIARKLSEQVF